MARRVWASPLHRAALKVAQQGGDSGVNPTLGATHIDGRTLRSLHRKGWVKEVFGIDGPRFALTPLGQAVLRRAEQDAEVTDLLPPD